ncbi:MAG: hypothetical protein H6767_01320 [Candidatus Peribacteria bacterium]|nr:MAG: hypothetical protein H6767_01320 [Candidatus Peribacteria bacterium]
MLRFIVPFFLIAIPAVSISSGGLSGILPAIIVDVILISLSIRIVSPNTVRTVEFL